MLAAAILEPMKRQEVLDTISAHKKTLDEFKVRSLSIFGSVARDDAIPGSDVDILVEFTEAVGLFHFIRLKTRLESILGTRVDLATPDALRKELRARVQSEAIRAA